MHRLIRLIGEASARRPWVTIAGWLVAAVALGLAAATGGTFADDFSAPGSESEQAMKLLEQRFPESAAGSAMAVFAVDGDGQLSEHRPAIDATLSRIAEVEHVATVSGPFEAGTVSTDGRVGFAQITFDVASVELGPEPLTALTAAIEPARGADLSTELGGDAVFINAETETSGAEAVGVLAALVVLVVAFGAVMAALVPIVLALIAVGTGVGGIALLANAMDVSSAAPTIGAMIGLGVGIDYALFIVARYREM